VLSGKKVVIINFAWVVWKLKKKWRRFFIKSGDFFFFFFFLDRLHPIKAKAALDL
jgi:hypothetical protein